MSACTTDEDFLGFSAKICLNYNHTPFVLHETRSPEGHWTAFSDMAFRTPIFQYSIFCIPKYAGSAPYDYLSYTLEILSQLYKQNERRGKMLLKFMEILLDIILTGESMKTLYLLNSFTSSSIKLEAVKDKRIVCIKGKAQISMKMGNSIRLNIN